MSIVLNTEQREQAGSDSYNRFEYQTHWIVCHIIDQLNTNGTGFNTQLKKYIVCNKNIFDIWDMTIDEAVEYFERVDKNYFPVKIELYEKCCNLFGNMLNK